MRALLDTHSLLWWLDGDRRLSPKARRVIGASANTIFVSAASAWEISTKVRIGKLPGAVEVAADIPSCIIQQNFESLAVSVLHGQRAGGLPGSHRDPFDRMLAAQAQTENLPIISNDPVFDDFGVSRIW